MAKKTEKGTTSKKQGISKKDRVKKKKDPKKNDDVNYSTDMINLEIHKSRLNVEKTTLIFNKGILLYFSFLFVGMFGYIQGYVTPFVLNMIIVLGVLALIVGAIPYIIVTKREENKLSDLIDIIKGRKGLSPLIATILLISFAVALGAVVMNFPTYEGSSCKQVNIDFEKIGGVPQICTTSSKLDIYVSNNGKVVVDKLKVIMIGGADEKEEVLDKKLDIAGLSHLALPIPSKIGFLRIVKIVPIIIDNDGKDTYCTEKDLIIKNVPKCE